MTKRYPGVVACDRVDLTVAAGELHGVLGENGAGKSTLMKIVYGAVRPDAGRVLVDGAAVTIGSPALAQRRGIAMVFQQPTVFTSMTVAENVWLGRQGRLSRREVSARIEALSRRHGLDLAPSRPVDELSLGERQRVSLVRALLTEPRLLILDEPTSVMTPAAALELFRILRALAGDGCAVLYVSHKLAEIRSLCDRCTVLRAGRVVAVVDPRRESDDSLATLMLGAPPAPPPREAPPAPGPPALVVKAPGIELEVAAGEVVGVAGISGNGQAQLLDLIAGETTGGTVQLLGEDVSRASPRARRERGLAYVPEEVSGHGAVPALSLGGNCLLTRRELVGRGGWLRRAPARRMAARIVERFAVKAVGPDAPAESLSGGNLQRFVVGRELDAAPKVLVAAQPTRGLDVGAAAQIHGALRALAAGGAAVLVVSEDLDELYEVCSSLVVMAAGRLSPRIPATPSSVPQIGRWMGGL